MSFIDSENSEEEKIQLNNDPELFRNDIERLVEYFGFNYIDAILHYCDENSVEVESIPGFLKANPKIMAAVQEEGEDLHFLKKTVRLPI